MPLPAEALARAYRLLGARDVEAALSAFESAKGCGADPDAADAGRWECLALLNRYGEAWAVSDEIAARAPGPFWAGELLQGRKLIVRCLHGFGDALQMIRYAPLLRTEAAELTVEANPALLPLLRACDGVGEVITWDPPPPEPPEWDVQAEVMELPWILRSVPAETPYLRAEKLLSSLETRALVARMEERRPTRPQIGLAWQSSSWNPLRSVPLALLAQALPEVCDLYSLQQGGAAELAGFARVRNIESDFADLAVRMAALDLLITIDGVLAHLAGALGLPTLLLLPFAADWRWGLSAETPWYPRAVLLRQPTPGDWAAPVAAAREHLRRVYGI